MTGDVSIDALLLFLIICVAGFGILAIFAMIVVEKTRDIGILKALGGGTARLGVTELADQLGLAKATVHGLLRTLQAHGLVEQHPDSDKYQLGPQLLQLSNRYLDLSELRSRSLAYSEALAGRADEAVRVGAFHGDGMLVVHHVFRPDASLQILEVGAMLPMHATATTTAPPGPVRPW